MAYSEKWAEAVRKALGDRSRRQIAPKVGCSPTYIGDWLTGRIPDEAYIRAFAAATGADAGELLHAAGYFVAQEHAADEEWKRGVAALEAEFGVFVVGSTEVYKDRRTVEAARRDLDTLRKALEGRRNVGGSGSASGESGGGSSRLDGPGGPGGVVGAPRYPGRGIRQPQPVPAAP